MNQTRRALIIGGGIAGPAVSLFLQRGGIEPLIFEAYPRPATIGGGFQIAPNGMRVLRALNLADRIAAAGAPSMIAKSLLIFVNDSIYAGDMPKCPPQMARTVCSE